MTASTGNTGNGTSNNTFSYVDTSGNTFDREVDAALNNITFDHQGGTLAPTSAVHFPFVSDTQAQLNTAVRFPGRRLKSTPDSK